MHRSDIEWYTCPDCGKRTYRSRADAKRAAKTLHDHVSAYPCPCDPGTWHIGHLPEHVMSGRAMRGVS